MKKIDFIRKKITQYSAINETKTMFKRISKDQHAEPFETGREDTW